MNKKCEQIQALIPPAAQGELDESARESVLSHAAQCPECANTLNFQTRLQCAIARDPLAVPPPVYFEGVLEEIHRRMPVAAPRRPKNRRRLQPQVFGTALMTVLALIWLGSGLPLISHSGGRSGTESAPQSAAMDARAPDRSLAQETPAAQFVLVKGYGAVSSKAEFLKYSAEVRRELGLDADKPKIVFTIQFRG